MKRHSSNNLGMGILEVIIALAIMTIVASGMMQMFASLFAQQSNAKSQSQAEAFGNEVRSLLSNKESCTFTFGGLLMTTALDAQLAEIRNNLNAVRYNKTSKYGDNSFSLKELRAYDYTEDLVPNGTFTFLIRFAQNGTQAPIDMVRTIRIKTERDIATNQLTTCVALAHMSDGIWQRVSTNLDDIFFTGKATQGRVGIGTSTPGFPLHVSVDQKEPAALDRYDNLFSSSLRMRRARGTPGAPAALQPNDEIGTLIFDPYTAAGFIDGAARMTAAVDGPVTPGSVPSALTFHTGTAANILNEKMRIASDGKIGVGTNQPTVALDIYSNMAQIDLTGVNIPGPYTNGQGSTILLKSSRGPNYLSRLPSNDTDQIGVVGALPFNADGAFHTSSAIAFYTQGAQTAANHGGYITFCTASAPADGLAEPAGECMSRMMITRQGKVGINANVLTGPAELLEVGGNIKGRTIYALNDLKASQNVYANDNIGAGGNITANGTITALSDIRLKKNITPIEHSLEKILELRGVNYFWKRDSAEAKRRSASKQIGLIAQEVEVQFPEAILTNSQGIKSVNYQGLIAPVVNAIKEIFAMIVSTDGEVAKLKSENQTLRDELTKLEVRDRLFEERLTKLEQASDVRK